MDKENIKKYFEEELTDSRLLVLIGYLLIEDELKKFSTKKCIDAFEKKLIEYKQTNSVSLKEAIVWIKYLRELKNTLSHNYLNQDEFNTLIKKLSFIDLATSKETKFKFDNEYSATNLSNREELKMLIFNIVCLIDLVKNPDKKEN
jgi:hypothetical protein